MTMMPSQTIRVMLVDDHTMVRKGLSLFLKAFDDLELVGEAENGADAIRLCGEIQPDVILMDMVMPDMDGVTATRTICQQFPQVKSHCTDQFQRGRPGPECPGSRSDRLLCSRMFPLMSLHGLSGMRIQDAPPSLPMPPKPLFRLPIKPPAPGLDLTEREREVLALMVEGLNNTQIAGKLGVSPSTIKSHVSNILSKLGVASRTEAVTLAFRHNLVS